MEFAEIKYTKTVEGNFEVQLIHNNTVVAHITFPTEELAAEYVDIKQKIKADYDAVLAKVKASLTLGTPEKEKAETVVAATTAKVAATESEVADVVDDLENKAENLVNNLKVRIEKQKPVDVSAKTPKSPDEDWQSSAKAKVGKDVVIDTSAKVVVTDQS